jgi:serine/threonine protein kinase
MSAYPPLYLEANMPSLSGIMRTKFLAKQSFSEAEVLNLMEGVIYGLAYLESRGLHFGDVHPSNIFYDQLRNVYKLGSPFFTESGLKQVKEGKRMSFLSPEQITSIYDEGYRLTPELLFKSDVFVLGMHLLEICTLESAEPCFNKEMRILDSEVQKRLQVVEQKYSGLVSEGIKLCLEYDSAKRPTPLALAMIAHEKYGSRY